jgi:CNP1-like family
VNVEEGLLMQSFDCPRQRRFAPILAGAIALILGAGPVQAQRGMPEDIGGVPEEEKFSEIKTVLPAYPRDADLVEFRPRGSSRNRFYIDANSVSIGADRVVRYTAVIKSPSGASNVSYEGLHCKTAEYKVYAFGIQGNKWSPSRDPKWQPVGPLVANYRFGLYKDYLCYSESIAGRNARELVANLKGDTFYNPNERNR